MHKKISFRPGRAALVPRVPQPGCRGISWAGLGRAARAVCGRWNRSSIPDFPGRGDGVHSLCSKLGSGKMLLLCLNPAAGVFMLLLAFIVCSFPLPSFCFFTVLIPNQQLYFHFFPPDFSAEKYPFCYLVGKQKLGLCQALEQLQRMKMVMVASSKPHFWLPLL